jgi:hypothetical protein
MATGGWASPSNSESSAAADILSASLAADASALRAGALALMVM